MSKALKNPALVDRSDSQREASRIVWETDDVAVGNLSRPSTADARSNRRQREFEPLVKETKTPAVVARRERPRSANSSPHDVGSRTSDAHRAPPLEATTTRVVLTIEHPRTGPRTESRHQSREGRRIRQGFVARSDAPANSYDSKEARLEAKRQAQRQRREERAHHESKVRSPRPPPRSKPSPSRSPGLGSRPIRSTRHKKKARERSHTGAGSHKIAIAVARRRALDSHAKAQQRQPDAHHKKMKKKKRKAKVKSNRKGSGEVDKNNSNESSASRRGTLEKWPSTQTNSDNAGPRDEDVANSRTADDQNDSVTRSKPVLDANSLLHLRSLQEHADLDAFMFAETDRIILTALPFKTAFRCYLRMREEPLAPERPMCRPVRQYFIVECMYRELNRRQVVVHKRIPIYMVRFLCLHSATLSRVFERWWSSSGHTDQRQRLGKFLNVLGGKGPAAVTKSRLLATQLGHIIASALRFYHAPTFDRVMIADAFLATMRIQGFARMLVARTRFEFLKFCALTIQCFFRMMNAKSFVQQKRVRATVLPLCPSSCIFV